MKLAKVVDVDGGMTEVDVWPVPANEAVVSVEIEVVDDRDLSMARTVAHYSPNQAELLAMNLIEAVAIARAVREGLK